MDLKSRNLLTSETFDFLEMIDFWHKTNLSNINEVINPSYGWYRFKSDDELLSEIKFKNLNTDKLKKSFLKRLRIYKNGNIYDSNIIDYKFNLDGID